MTNVTPNAGNAKIQTSAEIRQIGANWGKFSQQHLSAVKAKHDLVAQIVASLVQGKPAPFDVDLSPFLLASV